LPHVAREVAAQAAREVARVGLAVPRRQVRRIERIGGSERSLRGLERLARVLGIAAAELDAAQQALRRDPLGVDLAVLLLVLAQRRARAEDEVERGAGE